MNTRPLSVPSRSSIHRFIPCSVDQVQLMPFALATLLGAFLVFQVQPIISKCVLPWFGGTPAVWTTCMLFFQLLLFGGYVYAHVLKTRATVRTQVAIHIMLLIVAAISLPIEPSSTWKPQGEESPTGYLLTLLMVHVGLPYFVLSSTGPLMQAWLSTRVADNRVYRLYALSNAGSLAALISYPFVVEPLFTVSTQASIWAWMFFGFVLLQITVAGLVGYQKPASDSPPRPIAEVTKPVTVTRSQRLSWVMLTALASTLLLTTTNHVCQDVAVIPFLWLLPLSLYLISFILCFDSPNSYHPKRFAALALGCLVAMQLSRHMPASVSLWVDTIASISFLFFVCILCHGEVARLKPSVQHLTQYYTLMSAGGAIGGLVVAVFCPMWLHDYSEQSVTNTICASLALVIFFAAKNWTGRHYDWKRHYQFRIVAIALPLVSVGAAYQQKVVGIVDSDRNFFGVIRVEDKDGERRLVHGTTVHGVQRPTPNQAEPTSYYGRNSGIGKVLTMRNGIALKVCGVGLGCGVLATYGQAGDLYDFIEINPAVIRVASQHFSFMRDSAAEIRTHAGDGRLVLERMQNERFDVVALDAFSSDSIPAHLLTIEAMDLYRSRLTPDGIIAIHVSNKHLDLAPLVHRLARQCGLTSKLVHSPGDEVERTLPALWVIIANEDNALWAHPTMQSAKTPSQSVLTSAPLWTDQHHNLLSVFGSPDLTSH